MPSVVDEDLMETAVRTTNADRLAQAKFSKCCARKRRPEASIETESDGMEPRT